MTSAATNFLLPRDSAVTSRETQIGRWSVSDLAAAFGTPLYVYDAVTLRENTRQVQDAFAPLGARISFAAKACCTIGVLQTLQQCGLDVDVVSEGEMMAAIHAGFPSQRIHLHGNCKSDRELDFAVRTRVRAVVVDGAHELARLAAIISDARLGVNVMIRIALPLEAETHPWLRTSGLGSKFGVPIGSEEEARVITQLLDNPGFRFIGLHTHIGSQIADGDLYRRAAQDMAGVVTRFADAGLDSEEMSLGGGWAVAYGPEDPSLAAADVAAAVAPSFRSLGDIRPAVEPGRAIVAQAAVAVYRVGSVKSGPTGRVVAVDGGMGDNPRPALYDASYTAFLPARPLDAPVGTADIVGRYCEAGDVLARGVDLPVTEVGDLVCIPVSGAYQLSMASSYNLVPPPASVLVDGRDVRLMTRRATIDDMLSREVGYRDL